LKLRAQGNTKGLHVEQSPASTLSGCPSEFVEVVPARVASFQSHRHEERGGVDEFRPRFRAESRRPLKTTQFGGRAAPGDAAFCRCLAVLAISVMG